MAWICYVPRGRSIAEKRKGFARSSIAMAQRRDARYAVAKNGKAKAWICQAWARLNYALLRIGIALHS